MRIRYDIGPSNILYSIRYLLCKCKNFRPFHLLMVGSLVKVGDGVRQCPGGVADTEGDGSGPTRAAPRSPP